MKWVVQTNVYAEEGFETLLATLERFKLEHVVVKVVPFEGRLEPLQGELPEDGANVIVMGSYTLARVAKQRGWSPGSFLDNLDFRKQHIFWGDHMLNADARVCKFDEVLSVLRDMYTVKGETIPTFFLRPVDDSKAFTGYVLDVAEFVQWRENLRRMPETADPVNDPLGVNLMTLETEVMICTKKDIYNETRCWIVDSRLITYSGYKVGTIKRYTPPEEVDQRIQWFASARAHEWSPNRAYVMDIADTPNGLKIVEVNNLNSAGWYKGDLQKLVDALERTFTKRSYD